LFSALAFKPTCVIPVEKTLPCLSCCSAVQSRQTPRTGDYARCRVSSHSH
jgi:hypothetical protein